MALMATWRMFRQFGTVVAGWRGIVLDVVAAVGGVVMRRFGLFRRVLHFPLRFIGNCVQHWRCINFFFLFFLKFVEMNLRCRRDRCKRVVWQAAPPDDNRGPLSAPNSNISPLAAVLQSRKTPNTENGHQYYYYSSIQLPTRLLALYHR